MGSDRFPEPAEAIRFLEKKINVPTEKWDDLKWGEHAYAFTVAHSVEADILDGIHGLLNKAIAAGESYDTWKDGMLDAMEKKGWYGGAGHTKEDKKYINWRLRVIYDTNMRTAYAAARYRRQLQEAEGRPIWVYKSKLHGDNRRQEHIALHGKAFRYDDPFWDTYYPPNGWGCQCYVTTKSEAGAEREGIRAGDSAKEELPAIDETWKYNPGREALAPNFGKYKNLTGAKTADGRTVYSHIVERYQRDMDGTSLTAGELDALAGRIKQKDYTPMEINYQVGNLEGRRYEVMREAGVRDSKVMATDSRLYHGLAKKKKDGQKIPPELLENIHEICREPEGIYENTVPKYGRNGREFHFVKKIREGNVIKIVFRCRENTALQLITIGIVKDEYKKPAFKKLW